jgi:hypothetical protein
MTSFKKNRLGPILAGIVFTFAIARPAQSFAQTNAQPSLNDASGNGAVAVFKDFAKYPPESRPLNTSNWDLLHPWATDTSSLPMVPQQIMRQVDSLRASGLPEEEVLRAVPIPSSLPKYEFEMNKTILAGIHNEDELRARLTVTPTPGSSLPLRIHVTRAEIIGDSDFGSPNLGTAPFSCEANAPVCTFQWKAQSTQKQFWGALELEVTVTIEGGADEFVVRQSFYSSPMTAGRFTGSFQEKIENGSLVIAAGVEVQKRMACFVSANLFSADKEVPTHHVERRMIVDPSMKTVEFNFFGKIFRDFGHEGVFRLQDLKAQCENLPYPPEWFLDSIAHQAELLDFQNHPPATKEPSRIYFQYNNFTYTTHRYPNSVFADQEWQSPERTRKLEALKKAAAELSNPAMEERKRQLQQQLK